MSALRSAVCMLTLAVVTACGATVIDGGGGGASATTSSASSSSTTTSAAAGGQTGSGGGALSAGPWRADMWIGQVDHMGIRHLDLAADVCILMNATAPSQTGGYDIIMPRPWALHTIVAWDDSGSCMADEFMPVDPSVMADTATGSIQFVLEPMQIYPCALDVDVIVQFAEPPAWLPPNFAMQTSRLVVEGACP